MKQPHSISQLQRHCLRWAGETPALISYECQAQPRKVAVLICACNSLAKAQVIYMMGREPTEASGAVGQPLFATTHWSVVLAAAKQEEPEAAEALERLCSAYWYPLYAFVRRRGFRHEEAQDLTQAFFAHLLRKDFLDGVGPEKGRFRSFLLACLKHFLVDEWEKARTAKRGGGRPALPLDMEKAEERYQLEARVEADPESLFERRWALDLLERALARLRHEAAYSGRRALFDELVYRLIELGT
jgi:DNA-directed RNA polymerase specialized sigma24 family protein